MNDRLREALADDSIASAAAAVRMFDALAAGGDRVIWLDVPKPNQQKRRPAQAKRKRKRKQAQASKRANRPR